MTNEEAIKELKDRYELGLREYMNNLPEYMEILRMAIHALESRLAKPVEWQERTNRYNETVNEPFCPACGCAVDEDDSYCSYCGQKLLWESGDD